MAWLYIESIENKYCFENRGVSLREWTDESAVLYHTDYSKRRRDTASLYRGEPWTLLEFSIVLNFCKVRLVLPIELDVCLLIKRKKSIGEGQ